MFNFNQTKQIKDTATAKGLELWAREYLYILSKGGLSPKDYGDDIPQLTLDNLLPWFNKHFGGVENPSYTALHGQREAGINYYDDPSKIDHHTINWLDELMEVTPQTLADKLKQQATTQYFDSPQALADDICEAITTNF